MPAVFSVLFRADSWNNPSEVWTSKGGTTVFYIMAQKHKGRKHTPSKKPKAFPEDRRQCLLLRAQKYLRNEEGQKHMRLDDCCPHMTTPLKFFCNSFHQFPSSSGGPSSPLPNLDWKSVNNQTLLLCFPQTRFHGQLHSRYPRRRCVGNWLIQCNGIDLHKTCWHFWYGVFPVYISQFPSLDTLSGVPPAFTQVWW